MSTDSNPKDGLLGVVGELVGELGALLPRLVERSRDQFAVVAKLLEELPCLGTLGNGSSPTGAAQTPDLHLVPTGGEDTVDAEVVEPPVVAPAAEPTPPAPAPVTKAPAKKSPAKKSPAKKAPAAKVAAKKSPAKRAAAKKTPAKASTAAAGKAPSRKAPSRKTAAPAAPAPVAAAPVGLAIPDYDELAASQVIPRLDSMTPAELEAIRVHETSNRQRRTILSRVAQIQTG